MRKARDQVQRTRLGVWDFFEDLETEVDSVSGLSKSKRLQRCFPHVWRVLKEIISLRGCWFLLVAHVGFSIILALVPAISLW